MSKGMCTYVIRALTKTLHSESSFIRQTMKKYIFVLNATELLSKLYVGKRVEGVLFVDEDTGCLTFKAYNRKSKHRRKDVMLKKLPWGWVKESLERIKVFGSFPKEEGSVSVVGMLDEHVRDAERAIIDRDIVEFC